LEPDMLLPEEYYTFAIERNSTGYTLEASGNFARVGQKTLRFFRPFVVDDEPIWHYNVKPEEYDGRFNNDLKQVNWDYGSMTWEDQWPAGSAYPDYFVIGDLYTNVYEGKASLTDIRYYEPAAESPTVSPTEITPTESPWESPAESQPVVENPTESPIESPVESPTESPTERPTESPIESPIEIPSGSQPCNPIVFMGRNDRLDVGESILRDNVYLIQKANGNLEIRELSQNTIGSLLWESGVSSSIENNYYTKLQGDGNLITWKEGSDGSKSPVWKSRSVNSDGSYFFVLDCAANGGGAAIYQGHPQQGGTQLWSSLDTASPTTSPTPNEDASNALRFPLNSYSLWNTVLVLASLLLLVW